MKQILFLTLIILQTTVFSQNEAINGTYQFYFEGSNGTFGETIVLHPNGSFDIHSFKKLDGGSTPETNAYGKGTWKLEKKIVYFTTTKTDFDSKFTLDLNNTQARFHTKSSRDTSNRDIPTTLTIFESNKPWLVGRTLEKQ
ncbi:hypothetical protein [Formosa maritima]|uniref:Lipocalin-like domain-containing protein n=1 Tax=Formosa maritima TaxID=2592046 RepID=A0A5D0G0Q2_9FLAO|nr:hypothetical protein [Formosa maritima]TYA52304.1 hypothetical protein FVF61_13255 [Formosa maritima]